MFNAARCLAVAALLLSAAPAFAQTAPGQGATQDNAQDKAQDNAQEPPPKADPGTTAQFNCISDETKYSGTGRHKLARIELTNKCEQRLKCAVFAYFYTSKGPAHGQATLILAPKSTGDAATKSFEVKLKSIGGMGTVSRECRVI